MSIGDGSETTLRVAQRNVGEEGVVGWDAALVLAYFLQLHREELRLDQGINVIELGAGTGVVGLVAAALGYVDTIEKFFFFMALFIIFQTGHTYLFLHMYQWEKIA